MKNKYLKVLKSKLKTLSVNSVDALYPEDFFELIGCEGRSAREFVELLHKERLLKYKYSIRCSCGEELLLSEARILNINERILCNICGNDMDTELDNYEKSQKYYLEAVQFAERVHDFNLYSNSQLGIMLLSIKHEKEIDNDILRTIISETYSLGLNINYNYAIYVQHLIRNEDFSKELVTYWRKMHFSDLLSMSSKSESEKYNIKLTVM